MLIWGIFRSICGVFEMQMQRPIVAIIGRPNVGKSRLFNRILGRRAAIVDDQPGVTRDRHYGLCEDQGRWMTVVDTGGLDPTVDRGIMAQIRDQTQRAVEEADLLLFLMDGREGITPVDEEIVRILRNTQKTVFYVVNKIDGSKDHPRLYDFYRLGVQELYAVSAEHGDGVAEMLEAVMKAAPSDGASAEMGEKPPRIAVMGRPNVGKSTLVNTILGEDRMLTSDHPGTTRDPIDTLLEYKSKKYVMIDTAGIRRKGRVAWGVERWSVERSLKSLNRCDLALLLLDGGEGVVEQDTKIAGQITQSGRGCILLVNKWDLCSKEPGARERFRLELSRHFVFLAHVPILYLSALSPRNIPQVFSQIDRMMISYTQRLSTGDLNRFLQRLVKKTPPPSYRGHAVKFYYLTQVETRPPVFVAFSNYPAEIPPSYLRYLENHLRRAYHFPGVPIKIRVRKKR